jgi:hypothetical protein
MYRKKSDLMDHCLSFTALVKQDRAKALEVFFRQSDQCVFTMGACHVFAAALYNFLRESSLEVRVFKLCDEHSTPKHLVVGCRNGPYADVHLQWQSEAQIQDFWEDSTFRISDPIPLEDSKEPDIRLANCAGQASLVQPLFCTAPDFLKMARNRAKVCLAANEAEVRALVTGALKAKQKD